MDDIKKWFFYTILGISLVLTVWFWSTIQFIFLLSIGLVFSLWGINLLDERKSYAFAASVIGFVLSLVILLNYTPILLTQMGQEDAPAIELNEEIEEEQGFFDKIFGGESEPGGPEDPSLLDQYLGWVIFCNAASILLSIGTIVTRKKTDHRISKNVEIDNGKTNQSPILNQTPRQQSDKSSLNYFLATVKRWFSDES